MMNSITARLMPTAATACVPNWETNQVSTRLYTLVMSMETTEGTARESVSRAMGVFVIRSNCVIVSQKASPLPGGKGDEKVEKVMPFPITRGKSTIWNQAALAFLAMPKFRATSAAPPARPMRVVISAGSMKHSATTKNARRIHSGSSVFRYPETASARK